MSNESNTRASRKRSTKINLLTIKDVRAHLTGIANLTPFGSDNSLKRALKRFSRYASKMQRARVAYRAWVQHYGFSGFGVWSKPLTCLHGNAISNSNRGETRLSFIAKSQIPLTSESLSENFISKACITL